MKTKTDLRAGYTPGGCTEVMDKFGNCKKITCPYPPFNFPCDEKWRATRWGPGYRDVRGEDTFE